MANFEASSAASTRAARSGLNAPESIEIVPTGAALGAEIRGMDLSQPVPDASKIRLRQAWADHLVLLWRDQKLPDVSFLQAAEIFARTKKPAALKFQLAGGYAIVGNRVAPHPRVS